MKTQILLAQILNLFDVGCIEFAKMFDPDLEKISPRHMGAAITTTICKIVADDLGLDVEDVLSVYAERLAMEERGETV